MSYFYPRPPGGGRPFDSVRHLLTPSISIHALRVEGDEWFKSLYSELPIFLSTPSGWRATAFGSRSVVMRIFLSTPSGWRATYTTSEVHYGKGFLSTPSGWRATSGKTASMTLAFVFLSTPSGWRATTCTGNRTTRAPYFYPRPPGGGRQQKRTKFSSVFAQKGEEFASLRRGKRKICRWRFKKDKFWVLIWCEGSGKSVCALASHCG